MLVFAAFMGLLWLSTVPPTSGLVAVMFGTRHVGMLFGVVFLSHQVGAFFGAWLGGIVYEATGAYDLMWWLSIVLGLAAAVVHLPINEQRAPAWAPARHDARAATSRSCWFSACWPPAAPPTRRPPPRSRPAAASASSARSH